MLHTQGLVRRFGDRTAVDHVDLSVPDGELVGFVGGNGAGKTTTMRMIMGVLAPDEGSISWQDRPVTAQDRRGFGYMPEERGLYPKQPVLAQLVYLGRLQGMSQQAATASGTALLERFDLVDRAKDKLESLSLGNQQRVQIAAAVIADPRLLILTNRSPVWTRRPSTAWPTCCASTPPVASACSSPPTNWNSSSGSATG